MSRFVERAAYDAVCRENNRLNAELTDYHRLQKGCTACRRGGPERVMIDDDGVLCSVSGKPGRWGHCWGELYWYCADDGAVAENDRLRAALDGELRGEHVYNGLCPESDSIDSRDPDCPQCARLSAMCEAMARMPKPRSEP